MQVNRKVESSFPLRMIITEKTSRTINHIYAHMSTCKHAHTHTNLPLYLENTYNYLEKSKCYKA